MRGHCHDVDEGRELRLKADRTEAEDSGLMYKAAAAGRADVLGPAGLLGLRRPWVGTPRPGVVQVGRGGQIRAVQAVTHVTPIRPPSGPSSTSAVTRTETSTTITVDRELRTIAVVASSGADVSIHG
ncbi:MAG: hypothetical protein M3R63_18250 [Actinomycetota bacterium]|nr:hypothetical protein [Actinomycetota bacterium]